LIEVAIFWLGDRKQISLEVVKYNHLAINFYKKFGFIENGPALSDAGKLPNGKHLPEIEMIKYSIPT